MQVFADLHHYGDFGLLALRFAVGAIFLSHGLQKRAMWKMQPSAEMPKKMHSIMKVLSVCEPLGAMAMFSGFLTQLAAIGLGIIMFGAMNMKIKVWKKTFSQTDAGWELDFMIFSSCIALLLMGAGAYSLDRLVFAL